MKFRAKVKDAQLFLRTIRLVTNSPESIPRVLLTPKKVQFILIADLHDGFQVWSGLNQGTLFEDYRIESMNQNEIAFQLSLENLTRALKSAQNAANVVARLSKKNGLPYLTFTIDVTPARSISMTQDVPIELVPFSQIASMKEPHLPDPEVYIMMPVIKNLRFVIEKMKNLDDYVTIHANMGGELTFKVETEMVSLATFYRNLEHPTLPGRDPASLNKETHASCKVDIKKFSRFLYCHQVNPQNVICIVEGHALVLHVLVDDLFITYYIPVIVETA